MNRYRNSRSMLWKEYFIYDATVTLVAGTGVSFTTTQVRIDSDANFELVKSSYVATNDRIKLKFRDDSLGRYLAKDPIDIKSIAGRNTLPMGLSNAFMPFIWPRPYTLAAGSTFVVESADASSAANTMRLSFHGAKVRPGIAPWLTKAYRAEIPMIYGLSGGPITLGALSSDTGRIEIDVDSDFLVHKIVGIRTGAATVSISETARGREWMNTAVHIDNVIGNGAFPNILRDPRFISRGSNITINLTDLSGAANVIEVTMIGVKLYE